MSDRHIHHEHKLVLDEELQFKASVRRNKLLGLWAAAELGLSADEAEAYAKTVVSSDFKEPGDEDVFRKVSADFAAKGLTISEATLRQKMLALTVQVREQMQGEG
jgi:hypothetical protein